MCQGLASCIVFLMARGNCAIVFTVNVAKVFLLLNETHGEIASNCQSPVQVSRIKYDFIVRFNYDFRE